MPVVRYVFYRAVVLAALLFGFIRQPQGSPLGSLVVVGFAVISAASIVLVVAKYRNLISSPLGIYVDLVYYLATFIGMFAVIYWNYGTSKNFNVPLTHLDAIYFTIGTLSTAGTGNLVATSEFARGLQCLQMVLDLGFLLVAVTLVVTRLASHKPGSNPDSG